MDEIRLTGALPNLDLEIVRRDAGDGRETVTITMTATPTLGHAALSLLSNPALALAALPQPAGGVGSLGMADPMHLWVQAAEAVWRPWLQTAAAFNPFMTPFMDAMLGPTRRD